MLRVTARRGPCLDLGQCKVRWMGQQKIWDFSRLSDSVVVILGARRGNARAGRKAFGLLECSTAGARPPPPARRLLLRPSSLRRRPRGLRPPPPAALRLCTPTSPPGSVALASPALLLDRAQSTAPACGGSHSVSRPHFDKPVMYQVYTPLCAPSLISA